MSVNWLLNSSGSTQLLIIYLLGVIDYGHWKSINLLHIMLSNIPVCTSPDMNVISFLFLFVVSVHFLWNALLLLGCVANFTLPLKPKSKYHLLKKTCDGIAEGKLVCYTYI